jgi:hypothetical protein
MDPLRDKLCASRVPLGSDRFIAPGPGPTPGLIQQHESDWSGRLKPVSPQMTMHVVSFPLWLPALAAAIPAALLWRAGRRRVAGACVKCGYDLSGNTTGTCAPKRAHRRTRQNQKTRNPCGFSGCWCRV